MQVNLAKSVKSRVEHDELEQIIRSCVHCGFCNATCPTYQLTGNELDGPRGRIYLLKQMLEGEAVGPVTQNHLDRCLSCRSCETTCPSGVEYGRLLDLGRVIVEEKVPRPLLDQIKRQVMLFVFPDRQRFSWLMFVSRLCRPVLPRLLKHKIPVKQITEDWTASEHSRKVLLLAGCVQPSLAPSIDISAARVLDKLGISLIQVKSTSCCGALSYHLSEHDKAMALARKNIDQCWPLITQGVEAIIMTASGCGVTLKEYAKILQYDPDYAQKARQFSTLVKDMSEILLDQDLSVFKAGETRVAFQSPCTLQHGQQLTGVVESILRKIGYDLTDVDNAHICCGSAGVYSLLQPELSEKLRDNKLQDLHLENADCIATANIGCLSHLQASSSRKVIHWIELVDEKNTHTIY
jgi:glycolate oxidase iron-sulfur subunit